MASHSKLTSDLILWFEDLCCGLLLTSHVFMETFFFFSTQYSTCKNLPSCCMCLYPSTQGKLPVPLSPVSGLDSWFTGPQSESESDALKKLSVAPSLYYWQWELRRVTSALSTLVYTSPTPSPSMKTLWALSKRLVALRYVVTPHYVIHFHFIM